MIRYQTVDGHSLRVETSEHIVYTVSRAQRDGGEVIGELVKHGGGDDCWYDVRPRVGWRSDAPTLAEGLRALCAIAQVNGGWSLGS